jgi:hypothetical protein
VNEVISQAALLVKPDERICFPVRRGCFTQQEVPKGMRRITFPRMSRREQNRGPHPVFLPPPGRDPLAHAVRSVEPVRTEDEERDPADAVLVAPSLTAEGLGEEA